MNFSGYFLLASALVLVVFAQQPQASRRANETFQVIDNSSKRNQDNSVFPKSTSVLRDGFRKGTNFISSSENIIVAGISEAKQMINEDPEAAKQRLEQAFTDAKDEMSKAVIPYFRTFGEALALSNEDTQEGLRNASILLQKTGFAIINSLNAAKDAFEKGVDAGGNATELLFQAIAADVKTGYAGAYHNIQQSILTSDEALRDAQDGAVGATDEGPNCEVAKDDPEGGAEAVKAINKAADDALQRGGNADEIERFRREVICALGDLVVATSAGKNTVLNLKNTASSDPEGAREVFANLARGVKEAVHKVAARMYMIIGDVAYTSGNSDREEIGSAIVASETGKVQIIFGIDAAAEILGIGTSYRGDTPELAVDATALNGFYAKTADVQGIVKAAKLVLSVL